MLESFLKKELVSKSKCCVGVILKERVSVKSQNTVLESSKEELMLKVKMLYGHKCGVRFGRTNHNMSTF